MTVGELLEVINDNISVWIETADEKCIYHDEAGYIPPVHKTYNVVNVYPQKIKALYGMNSIVVQVNKEA